MASEAIAQTLVGEIGADTFQQWYDEQEFARNIRKGNPSFNHPSTVDDPGVHAPSSLLECHRKRLYAAEKAPREEALPQGLFWFGRRFETDIILPYLQTVAPEDVYVQGSVWVDTELQTADRSLRIKGMTDPVFVEPSGAPLLVTEVKTKQSLQDTVQVSQRHRAQIHAYMKGLTDRFERSVSDAVVIYGSRQSLNLKSFHVEFDPEFWRTVREWAAEQTHYRVDNELPPATPQQPWECEWCDYRERCGKGDQPFADVGPVGFLPLVSGYPRAAVAGYLRAHADEAVKLTPTLAVEYPDLAEEYGAYDWYCPACDASVDWDAVPAAPENGRPPVCPACSEQGCLSTLTGPTPTEQQAAMADATDND